MNICRRDRNKNWFADFLLACILLKLKKIKKKLKSWFVPLGNTPVVNLKSDDFSCTKYFMLMIYSDKCVHAGSGNNGREALPGAVPSESILPSSSNSEFCGLFISWMMLPFKDFPLP